MEELFSHILDEDEKIIKVFKPNKCKFYWSAFVKYTISIGIFVLVSILSIFLDTETNAKPIYALIPVGIYFVLLLLIMLLAKIYYKNLYFAYSNKRVIVRTGIFGVDFKSLDMSMIGAVDVYVSLLDKIIKKNTGSLSFGSAASPVGGNNANGYKFNHIVAPYETCKEIKSYIDAYKKSIHSK